MKTGNKLIGTGVLTAVTASLCCITPVWAFLAGASGMASAFSWLKPARPYLTGITILILAFAWYQKLKPKREMTDCDCVPHEKHKFIQSKRFLGIVTAFIILTLSFPFYAHIFYPRTEKQMIIADRLNTKTVEFKIKGMTCTGCANHINHSVNKLDGVITSIASYEHGNAIVEFDSSKTSVGKIEKAINSIGYTIIQSTIKE
jgi:mercuric ion transport protein